MVILANEVRAMEKTEILKNIQKRRALFETYLRNRSREKKPAPACQNLRQQSAASKK